MRQIALVLMISGIAAADESLTVSGDLRGMVEAHLTAIAEKHWTSRAAKVAAMKTAEDVQRRQAYIRQTILDSFGGFPEKTPLRERITGTIERDGYRIEQLIYESLPGFRVTANVYVPTNSSGPFPAVLGVAGHSNDGKAQGVYQMGWIGMVKRGFLVLAYDPPGQGERSEYWDSTLGKSRVGIGTREHSMAGVQCLLTGSNIARYEVWDGIRAVDYLLTRRDVDSKRLAVAGNSGGGTQSAYLAALEPRLAAAAPSCYITAWNKQWFAGGPQDAEQNFHGFLSSELDFGDFLIAMAPRPIKMMTAIQDFFPIEGARSTFRQVAGVFELTGARDKVDFFEYDDKHGWSKPRREATYRWFEKWLHGRDDEGIEPEITVEPAKTLAVTATGQLATSGGSETVASLNRKAAEQMYAGRAAANGGDLRQLVTRRLGIAISGRPAVRKMGEVGREGYRIEKLEIEPESGITLPALVFVPAGGSRPRPAVLFVNQAGKAADAGPGGDIESLVRAGHIVMAIDPRGIGESAPSPRSGGYTSGYSQFMRAYLVGMTVAGMQVADLLQAYRVLRDQPGVDGQRIAVFGRGNGGVLALYVAAMEPGVRKVAAERSVTSYMAIARAPQHEGVLDIVVPGVLKDFDLPDLVRAIGPRPVWIVDPLTPTGAPAEADEYAKQPALRVASRPDGWTFGKVYADWMGF